jgi:hypothetical protein
MGILGLGILGLGILGLGILELGILELDDRAGRIGIRPQIVTNPGSILP